MEDEISGEPQFGGTSVWAEVVLSAGIQDWAGARLLLLRLWNVVYRGLLIFADSAYTGTLIEWAKQMFAWTLTIVTRHAHAFKVLPWRWLVERTFAWLNNAHRLSKDYETLPASSECFVQITMIGLMLRRLENTHHV